MSQDQDTEWTYANVLFNVAAQIETDTSVRVGHPAAEAALRVVRFLLEAASQRLLRLGVSGDAIAVLRLADALAPPAADEQSPDGTS